MRLFGEKLRNFGAWCNAGIAVGIFSALVAWNASASCLTDSLLKALLAQNSEQFESLDDLAETPPLVSQAIGQAPESLDARGRLKLLQNFPIADLTAAPGHRYPRNLEQITALVKHIRESGGGNFSHDKVLINVVTDPTGTVRTVDIWNAHHRAVAYVEAGYKFLGELKPDNVEILINGKTSHGEKWDHFLPVAGVDTKGVGDLKVVRGTSVSPGTIAVDGARSNYSLGSRNSIRKLHQTIMRRQAPKVGVYFGTFDPPHEGHFQAMRRAIDELGLDELLIIPNGNPMHKPNASALTDRVAMLAARIASEPKINLYVGDSSVIIDQFGSDPLIERVAQIYGTRQIYQIEGGDAYLKLLEAGVITPASSGKYFILPRVGIKPPSVPAELSKVVTVSQSVDSLGLSSTLIRELISKGQTPEATSLHPAVLKYIQERRLYRNGAQ